MLGAVLLLAMLMVVISVYQAAWVPAENKEVEFDAYTEAISDMKELRTAYLDAASTGNVLGRVVKTGAQYPSRILFVNPPNPNGRVTTTPPSDVTLNNFTTKTASDYWDGSTHRYSTRKVRFTPAYNELSVPEMTLSPWGPLYQNASGRYVVRSGQFLVNGTNLQFLLLNNAVDESGYTSEVDVESFQTYRVVRIRNDTHRPSIEVPSTIPAERWRTDDDLLEGELATGDVHAVEQAGPGRIRVVLERKKTYILKMAGQSLPPDLVENTQTVAEAGLEGGVGVAGISDFEFDSAEILSTQGGVWLNINETDSINISDPRFVPLDGSHQGDLTTRYFRLVFTIENSTTRYTYLLPSADAGLSIDLTKSRGSNNHFSNLGVDVYKYKKGTTGVSELIKNEDLDADALDAWYYEDRKIDLLDPLSYNQTNDVDTQLNEIRSMTDGNETAEMFIGHMHGRVFMQMGTAGQGGTGSGVTTTYLDCPMTDNIGTSTNCTNAQSASDGEAVANLTEENTRNQNNPRYELDIEAGFSGVPSGTNELQIRYRITGDTEPVDIQVGDGAGGWTTRGTLSSTTFANFTYTLAAGEYNGGSPQIRFIDTSDDGTQTTVEIDYARIQTN